MSLAYKGARDSTTLTERAADGRERKVVATAGHPNQGEHWDLTVEEANGQTKVRTFNGNRRQVVLAMESLLDSTRNDFRNNYAQPRALYDKIVSVDQEPAYVGSLADVQRYIKR